MKSMKHIFLLILVLLTVLSLLLSACGPIDISKGNPNGEKTRHNGNQKDTDHGKDQGVSADKITICHKTGSAKNHYVEITLSVNATTNGHGTHDGDLIPAPEGGCPAASADTEDNGSSADKITICHKTGSAKNPYVAITVSADAITDGHGTHEGDLIPAPENGCPNTVIVDVPAR